MEANQPIGIFDSGIGGLTVAHAFTRLLPKESIVYFGDTVHLPYGDKSAEAIQSYALGISDFLLQQKCKVILIACYSASSAAFEILNTQLADKVRIINVIDPIVDYLIKNYQNHKVGLIGTRRTIQSNIFTEKLLNQNIQLQSLATPLFAPIIEEGFHDHPVIDAMIHEYLSTSNLNDINALVLACTHYPLIKTKIENYFAGRAKVIDTSLVAAEYLKEYLIANQLVNESNETQRKFYVSDYTESFARSAQTFFSGSIELERCPIWD